MSLSLTCLSLYDHIYLLGLHTLLGSGLLSSYKGSMAITDSEHNTFPLSRLQIVQVEWSLDTCNMFGVPIVKNGTTYQQYFLV